VKDCLQYKVYVLKITPMVRNILCPFETVRHEVRLLPTSRIFRSLPPPLPPTSVSVVIFLAIQVVSQAVSPAHLFL
jgi:hypothetical protein